MAWKLKKVTYRLKGKTNEIENRNTNLNLEKKKKNCEQTFCKEKDPDLNSCLYLQYFSLFINLDINIYAGKQNIEKSKLNYYTNFKFLFDY